MNDPTIFIRQNPLDLPPAERLKRVREILRKEDRSDWAKSIRPLIDPNAPVSRGRVTVADRSGAAQVHWRQSMTAPGTTGGQLRGHVVHAESDPWAHLRQAPKRRDPQRRVESMIRRYVSEVKAGNAAVIDKLGKDIVGHYWKRGMALTEDGLRTLAAASLQEAEMRQKRAHHKKSVSPWAIK